MIFLEFFMTINERICEIIKQEKMSVAAFARAIGVGDQTVRSVCVMRRNKPSFDFLYAIVQTFDWLNPEWLITGQGEMRRSPEEMKAEQNKADISALVEYMRDKDRKIEALIVERELWKSRYDQVANRYSLGRSSLR